MDRWKRDGAVVRTPLGETEQTASGRRFTLARYFDDLRRAILNHWHPDVVYRRIDSTGTIHGNRDRLTILRIKIRSDGSLDSWTLNRLSGLDWLDQEAVAAVKAAQPFPPPPELLLKDGIMTFRFGFLFEIGAGKQAITSPP